MTRPRSIPRFLRGPWVPLLALTLAAPAAQAQVQDTVWTDPSLQEAVRDADLIVLGEVTTVGKDGAAWRVVTTLHGPTRDGDEVFVAGLHHPGRGDQPKPPVAPGDRAYLLLRGDPAGETFAIATPTFGRFPVRDFGGRTLVVASLGDTYVRLPLEPIRFERFLAGVLGAPVPELLAEARRSLDAGADATETFVALRALGLVGGREDEARVLGVLDTEAFQHPARFRVRMAAAQALGRVATPAAVTRLLTLAAEDRVPAVRSTAALALEPAIATQGPEWEGRGDAERRLGELALEASSEPIRFANAEDPRENELQAPLSALLRTLAGLGAKEGVRPALRALERSEDLEAVWAGLAYFEALGDPEHAGAIAHRMRTPDAEDALYNRLFARTLEQLTGESLGTEREAWLRWWRGRALGPGGEVGPPVTPGGAEEAPGDGAEDGR